MRVGTCLVGVFVEACKAHGDPWLELIRKYEFGISLGLTSNEVTGTENLNLF